MVKVASVQGVDRLNSMQKWRLYLVDIHAPIGVHS